ncbi:MAG: glycoside hydrolase, partial [Proteobacteria bacterium]|nr:glycoside hydrolase [Pseudomonadota bacterium]
AWDLLVDARAAYLQVAATLPEAQRNEATRRLSICEGSDWFWWFGDYNPQQTIASFDSLFRLHLTRLYESLGLPAPGSLSERIHGESTGGEAEGGGAMRRSSAG